MSKPRKLRKPPSVASNVFKSKKWDELTSGRTFSKSDIPTLEMLCQWYANQSSLFNLKGRILA